MLYNIHNYIQNATQLIYLYDCNRFFSCDEKKYYMKFIYTRVYTAEKMDSDKYIVFIQYENLSTAVAGLLSATFSPTVLLIPSFLSFFFFFFCFSLTEDLVWHIDREATARCITTSRVAL